jgi:hypothetical protein
VERPLVRAEGGVTEPLREPWDERSHGMSTSPRPSNFKRLARRVGDPDFELNDLGERTDWLLSSSEDDVSVVSESEISAIGLVCSPPLPLCADAIVPSHRTAAAGSQPAQRAHLRAGVAAAPSSWSSSCGSLTMH